MKTNPQAQPLAEGIDYYIEAGRWVFTAAYLLHRGECCNSGCRHCPYKTATKPSAIKNEQPENR